MREEERKLHTHQRRDLQKSMHGQTKVTQKQRLEERRAHRSHHTHDTRRGT